MNVNCICKDILMTSRTLNIQLLCLVFTPNICGHIGLFIILPKVGFWYECFLLSFSIFFLEHLYAMVSISSIEEDATVTI